MTQTTGRFFDDMARIMSGAAGAAESVRREAEGAMRARAERMLRDMDVVTRDEFEAVKAVAAKALAENAALAARLAALEAAMQPARGSDLPPEA